MKVSACDLAKNEIFIDSRPTPEWEAYARKLMDSSKSIDARCIGR